MKVKLTIYNGEKEYFSRAISTPCVIGRGKQSDVAILHPLISRQHCEIYDEDGRVLVRDLGSLNGTFFKNARIGRGVPIPFGASFMIGRLSFKVEKFVDSINVGSSPNGDFPPSDVPTDVKESRAELRQRALDALGDFEKLDSSELGLAPENEERDEPKELELTPLNKTSVSPSQNFAQEKNANVEKAREEDAPVDAPVDDDVIDLEKFLKGEL